MPDVPRISRTIESWLTDMDGVLVHEERAIPGAPEFIAALREQGRPFLVLTNNSIFTPRDLSARLRASGIEVPEESIWTSALATADFLRRQHPGAPVYCIGEVGLTSAIHEAGFVMHGAQPEYVILGETRTYSFEQITAAIRFIDKGARFIATNPDRTGPSPDGALPATGAVAAMITAATGRDPYFVGKPNPMMFRSALNRIDAHSENTGMIGDRMDTDIVAGMEAGLETFLVMTGSTKTADVPTFPFRPDHIIDSIADLIPLAIDNTAVPNERDVPTATGGIPLTSQGK